MSYLSRTGMDEEYFQFLGHLILLSNAHVVSGLFTENVSSITYTYQ